MSTFSTLTRAAHVRQGFTEQDDWRDALGNAEPLHIAVTDGPIDAPAVLPAGGMRTTNRGSTQCYAFRND